MLGRPGKDPSYVMSRHVVTVRLMTLVLLLASPALAHAHGAMSGDELGPPLLTAALLGFVSYWVVMLWPSSHKNQTPRSGSNRQNEHRAASRRPGKAGSAKRLTVSGRVGPTPVARRRASEEESSNG